VDSIPQDALSCAFEHMGMGDATEAHNATYRLTRAEQDHIAVQSHQRAAAAIESGTFVDEIVAVGDFAVDEGVRPTTTNESLAKLRPAFAAEGTITAGNASQISDGAAAVVVMSKARAQSLGLTWIAEIVSHGNVAGPDASLHQQPANAIEAAALKADIEIEDIKLFEINEAFAAIAVVSMRQLGVDESKVNVNGGAIALGHPVGMSGARLVLHLAHELGRRGGGLGAAALCGGGGQGDALIIRVSGA
jgi:acetyl-CoA C-acetyltransferase